MDTSDSVNMLAAAWEALGIMTDPMRLAVLTLAAFLGVVLGIIPGIGGLAGTALLLPFTFAMDPYTAFAFLLGLGATTATGDPIPAILFGVPGGAGSAATVLDGLPMAKRGEAGRALSAAYMSSLLGGLFGALLLGLSVPILRPVMLNIGTPEMLAISILGLSMVAALSSSTPLRGLAAAAIGVMIAMIGSEPRTGTFRWTFGNLYLWEGLPLVPITIGLFALPELCDMLIARHSFKGKPMHDVKSKVWQGAVDTFQNWWLVLRCSWIGTALGAIPGIGGAVVDWVAYAHAARSVKQPHTIGSGDVRGVIASESANNAKEGGSLMTTIAFGIPGSAGMAIILGAFLSQGLVPGPDMLTKNLPVTYSMVWSIALANIVGAGLCYAFSPQFARLATLRYSLVLPIVTCIIFIGAFEGSRQWGDLIALLLFGTLGWTMKRLRWPRAPLILGVVLGDVVERQLFISIQLYGAEWLLRPAVMVILAIALVGLLRPAVRSLWSKRKQGFSLKLSRPRLSSSDLFPLVLLGAIGFLMLQTSRWPTMTALVPNIVTGTAVAAILVSLLNGIFRRGARLASAADQAKEEAGRVLHMDIAGENEGMTNGQIIRRGLTFLGWLLSFLAGMATIGIIPTIPLFIIAFMRIEARERWVLTLSMAAGMTLFVYVVFDQLLRLAWPATLIGNLMPALQVIPSM